jgi:hypothetical protein
MIKKVATKQIIVTPNAGSHVRLDELNKILDGIEHGDEATKRLQEIDKSAGLVDPTKKRGPLHDRPSEIDQSAVDMTNLNDEGLAQQRIEQSKVLAKEADSLLNESIRLQKEAWELDPSLQPKVRKKRSPRKKAAVKKKATTKKKDVEVTEPKNTPVKET